MSDGLSGKTHAGQRPSVVSLNINSKSALFSAYMSFLKRGGLFIPTTRSYALGEEIFMLLTLMDEPERLQIAGTVAWVTPVGAQGNKPQGIGVHFNDDESCKAVRAKIETLLGGYVSTQRQPNTL